MKPFVNYRSAPRPSPSRRALFELPLAAVTPRMSPPSQAAPYARTLVVIFLRGGMDGLSLVAPASDQHYLTERGALAVTPGAGASLDGYFTLGPAGAALLPLYQSGRLAFVHRVGALGNSLSHFDANVFVESGRGPGNAPPLSTGWLARRLQQFPSTGLLRAINHSTIQPWALRGADKSLAVANPESYTLPQLPGVDTRVLRKNELRAAFSTSPTQVGPRGVSSADAIDLFAGVTNWSGANYPVGKPIGDMLRRTEVLIRRQEQPAAGFNLDAVAIDYDGWDHHTGLSPLAPDNHGIGYFSMMQALAQSLAAFDNNLVSSGLGNRYVVLVMSEFGRRISANGSSGGLDHGAGNCWMVLGNGVAGGVVHDGGWFASGAGLDGLEDANGNLDIHYDYRNLLTDILVRRFGMSNQPPAVQQVFPGLNYTSTGVLL